MVTKIPDGQIKINVETRKIQVDIARNQTVQRHIPIGSREQGARQTGPWPFKCFQGSRPVAIVAPTGDRMTEIESCWIFDAAETPSPRGIRPLAGSTASRACSIASIPRDMQLPAVRSESQTEVNLGVRCGAGYNKKTAWAATRLLPVLSRTTPAARRKGQGLEQ
jgi:hypothetical protein